MNITLIRPCVLAAGLAMTFALPTNAQRPRPTSTRNLTEIEMPGWDIAVASAVTPTQISGDAGSANIVTGPTGTVLTGISFYERTDRPCRLMLHFSSWSLDADQEPRDEEYSSVQEGNSSCNGDEERIGAGSGQAMSGIQICQRAGNDRIKGARTHARGLTPTGSTGAGGNFERRNCNEWQSWVDCSNGQVATGAVVHWSNAAVVGIALRCSNVTITRQGRDGIRPVETLPVLTTTGSSAGTGISGMSATEQILSSSTPNVALQKLTYGEHNDRPCYLQAVFWTDNPQQQWLPVTFNECDGNHTANQSIEIPSNWDATQVASSIVVCQRSQNDRLKGIKLLGSRIDASGATPDPAIHDEHERPNCNEWNTPAHCTQGSVITGVRVHFRATTNRPSEIVGLGVNCSTATRN